MQTRLYNFLFIAVIGLIIVSCANRGSPSGGEMDITPPKIVKSIPENFSTNFKSKEIKIYFNEYIKIKNLSKQLIVSPPMENAPEITPLGTASKYITIKIHDTLKPNTTYAFNFGNSILDNNEENPFTYYRYVLSTGDYIDSLTVKGSIKNALDFESDTYVSVALYEYNDTYSDSLIYKRTPDYVTNTLDSTTNFTIENVKAGTYMLRALKDKNSDNKFQQKTDKIAFYETPITVPNDSAFYKLNLFSEVSHYKASKPKLVSGEKIAFGFDGDYKHANITLLSQAPNSFKARTMKEEGKDTINYFYSPKLEVDSLIFKVANKMVVDTFTVRIKDNKRDSLVVTPFPKNAIKPNEDFTLSANIPFSRFDEQKMTIRDKDSVVVPYKVAYDSLQNTYRFNFDKTEENKYTIELLPEAITDFFENKNDTIKYSLRTLAANKYANIRVNLSNAVYPIILQLTNNKGEVKAEAYVTEPKPVDFEFLEANTYYLRAIFDTNKNGKYDTGNYLKGIQPERVSYADKVVEGRSGWDEIVYFTLLD
ncbi:Ig-like domain-containing domain [Bizionia paragorgiae]|uniref:Ig-like domain-containing domain n=1 Tax=Bizionia paragorgiae TaxID=283786 RepID=UPI003A94BDD0